MNSENFVLFGSHGKKYTRETYKAMNGKKKTERRRRISFGSHSHTECFSFLWKWMIFYLYIQRNSTTYFLCPKQVYREKFQSNASLQNSFKNTLFQAGTVAEAGNRVQLVCRCSGSGVVVTAPAPAPAPQFEHIA